MQRDRLIVVAGVSLLAISATTGVAMALDSRGSAGQLVIQVDRHSDGHASHRGAGSLHASNREARPGAMPSDRLGGHLCDAMEQSSHL